MSVSIILSTFGERVRKISFSEAYTRIPIIVIHQIGDHSFSNEIAFSDLLLITDKGSGLSRSRNIGLNAAKTKFVYIMDDDVEFDHVRILELSDWMEANKIDVATAMFQFKDGSFARKYSSRPHRHTMLSAAKVSSIEICVNVEKLKEKDISFDECFGLGTDLPSGEEYIFITDCIKAGLNVWFYPITTGVHPNITSGMDFYTSSCKTLAKREMFKRIFGRKAFLFILAFWLKKTPKVLKAGYLWPFTKTMLLGLK